MAGGKQEEHAFRKIGGDLSAGRLPSALLLFGREQFLVKWAAGAIAEKYVPPALRELDFIRLDGGETDVAAVVAHCETLPLSGIKKIVLVEGVACFSADG
ncbi:MAG: hypothetical protein LBT26_10245, partial [Clostridiales Family XIII bacterium]|nr:hypothetical protein [Clostridiales Family XIII bacterium]